MNLWGDDLPGQPLRATEENRLIVAAVKSPPSPKQITPKSLELTKENKDFLLGLHREMQLIRRFEERAQEQYTKAKIGRAHV